MGTIVIHAGMGKTGSTSIQSWLGDHGQRVRDEAGFTVLKADVDASGVVQTEVHSTKTVNSAGLAQHYATNAKQRREIMDAFVTQLDALAERHGAVVLSAEGLSRPIWTEDEVFVGVLDDLGARHEVKIAYYVRPQHTAIEAAWREAGYKAHRSPSEFCEWNGERRHYHRAMAFVAATAPKVDFVPRPFRRDLLADGNVVADFAETFLGMSPSPDMNVWDNPGLPLTVVNLLRPAAEGLLWSTPQDTRLQERVKAFVADLELEESERVRRSRLVLQQACHERFEAENLEMIAALGWPTDSWVAAASEDVGDASFARMDELWSPEANEAELALLHHALARLASPPGRRAQGRRRQQTVPAPAPPGPVLGGLRARLDRHPVGRTALGIARSLRRAIGSG